MNDIRDAYFVAFKTEKSNLHMNDKLYISDQYTNNVFDEHYNIVGTMTNLIDDIYDIDDMLYQFRKDCVIPVNTDDKYIYCNIQDVINFDLAEAVVVYSNDELIIGYLGTLELEDGTNMTHYEYINGDFINHSAIPFDEFGEEERYSITDEGLKYLKELEQGYHLEDYVDYSYELINEIFNQACETCEREEENSMDNLFGNLGFGKANTNRFKLSMNGIAVKKDGEYVVYNKETNEFVNVSNLIFDIKDAIFILPSAEVSAGDMVIHEGLVYTIVSTKDNEIKAVSYEDCTQTVLIPKSTMFGIKYFSKVFSILGDNFATSKDLFSNPMMLMALIDGKDSGLSNIMLMNAMSTGDLASNPMALAMMLKGDKSDDSLSTLAFMSMFSNGTNPFAPKKANKEKASN